MRRIVAAGALGAVVGALVGIAWALDREEAPGLADACMLALDRHATLGEARGAYSGLCNVRRRYPGEL